MYYTNEYIVLRPLDGSIDIILKPGIQNKFPAFEGEFRPLQSGMLIDEDTSKVVMIVDVAKIFYGVGTIPKPKKVIKEKIIIEEVEPTLKEEVPLTLLDEPTDG